MKKKLFSAALIIAALATSFSVSAQEPTTVSTENTEVTTAKIRKADKKDRTKKNEDKSARKEGRKGQRPDLFKGITLSAEQQSQIDALRPQRPERADKKSTDNTADKAKSDKKANGDKKDRKGNRDGQSRKAARSEYISKVKEILTPDQYVVFLENVANAPAPAKANHRHNSKARHDKKAGERTVCPENNSTDGAAK